MSLTFGTAFAFSLQVIFLFLKDAEKLKYFC